MRLFHKIAVIVVGAAVLPIATVGFFLVARHQRVIEADVHARFARLARHAAQAVANDVEERARTVARLARMVPWDRLSPEELRGALQLVRSEARAREAFVADEEGRPRDASQGVRETAALVPTLRRALREGSGAVVFSPPTERTTVAAVAVPGGALALAFDLDAERRHLDAVREEEAIRVALVIDGADGQELVVSPPGGARPPQPIRASAPVGGLGWSVTVETAAASALATPIAIRRQTLGLIAGALGVALLLAFLFARGLTGSLERLAEAARALGRGELTARVALGSADEVGELGRAFNRMGDELKESREEIVRWNKTLEERVEARTRELKEAQAQLVQAQKLAALGQLGAGVAHEINNPLGGVIGHVELLLSGRDQKSPDYEALKCIEEGARRASQVVHNLLRFSVQRKDAVRTNVDANRLVRETLSLTETTLRDQKIDLQLALSDPPPRLRADGGQLAQVLLNLVANARTAMPGGGRLTVATASEGAETTIAVEDSGRGIAPEIRERIFEPFFTTKDDWSNVGLGLSVSYRIIAEHGGRIDVRSEVGRGARFTLHLPSPG